MSRTLTPASSFSVTRVRFAVGMTAARQLNRAGCGGAGPPGLGLGNASGFGTGLGVVDEWMVGVGESRAAVPGNPVQAHSATSTDARTSGLTYAITANPNRRYEG